MNVLMILAFGGAGGCFIGLAIAKKNRERERYYKSLVELCARIISFISFKEERIEEILRGAEVSSAALKRNIASYLAYIGGEEFKLECDLISKAEREEVKDFFLVLGKFDAETQVAEVRRRQSEFESRLGAISRKNDRQGNMYVKLVFLSGLLAAILLI